MNMRATLSVALMTTTALMTSLQAEKLSDSLDKKRADFLASAPKEAIKSYQDGIDAVAASGIYNKALKTGDKAPDFELEDAFGNKVSLSSLLKKGPVVLTWYRGGWCPYCNIALRALSMKEPMFKEAGAQIVALTPEKPDFTAETMKENELPFVVLSDLGNKVARDYGIVFKMTPDVAKAMRKFASTHERNGDESDELPLAATYVIDTDGTISYAFLDADYRNRAEPDRIVDAVEALSGELKGEHLVQTFWEGVWNPPYHLDLIDTMVSKDFKLVSAGKTVSGREAFKQWVLGFQSKLKDCRLKSLDTFASADGSKVVSYWVVTGRNNGLFGLPADDADVEFTGIAIWGVKDGKLISNRVERSAYELHQQLVGAEK